MRAVTGRSAEKNSAPGVRVGRRARVVSATVGLLTAAGVVFAPSASALDVQQDQWYLGPMQAEQMWKASTGKGVKVAVIDSGVNPHTDSLRGQVLVDEVPESVAYGATDDYTGHGTSMAELIAGTGAGGGVRGLAPGAKIVPYRVYLEDLTGEEKERKTALSAEAIKAAADTDAKILSMSFGSEFINPAVEAAITYAASKGKLLIASVGNNGEGDAHIGYPAAYPYVIGVTSLGRNNKISKFSSRGQYVDLVAPGEDIPGYCRPDFTTYCRGLMGTSASTAIVSASAALIWSAHPDWTANQVTRALIDTASRKWPKDDPTQYAGYGTVRPRKVLEDPEYDAGPAYSDPLAEWNRSEGEPLVTEIPPSSAPASPSGPASSPPRAAGGEADGDGPTAAPAQNASSAGDGGNGLWIALGAAVAAIVLVGGTVAVRRSRRTA
ncbi:S8 family serine peptidase [Streptomyces sp. NPDC052077]|uniref:S8 family serine peptidase n=1 Tax=Streptomyces sp. NPDC052077 TaxID=3154757 RepID=UPI00341C5C7E